MVQKPQDYLSSAMTKSKDVQDSGRSLTKVLAENVARTYAKSGLVSLSQQESTMSTFDMICQTAKPHHQPHQPHQIPARSPNLDELDCELFTENFHPNLMPPEPTTVPSLLPDINRYLLVLRNTL